MFKWLLLAWLATGIIELCLIFIGHGTGLYILGDIAVISAHISRWIAIPLLIAGVYELTKKLKRKKKDTKEP